MDKHLSNYVNYPKKIYLGHPTEEIESSPPLYRQAIRKSKHSLDTYPAISYVDLFWNNLLCLFWLLPGEFAHCWSVFIQ